METVNKPNHYIGEHGLEVEEVLRNFLTRYTNSYEAHRIASAIEYLLRSPLKNGTEDLRKAKRNIEQVLEYRERNEHAKKMDNIKEELIKLGATSISLKSTVSRIEFRKKKETIEIVVSLQGIMCKNKNSSDSHILPVDFVNPIIDIMNIYLGGF